LFQQENNKKKTLPNSIYPSIYPLLPANSCVARPSIQDSNRAHKENNRFKKTKMTTASLGLEGNAYVWIQQPRLCSEFHRPSSTYTPRKPSSMSTVDKVIWNDFTREMTKHVPSLNYGLRLMMVINVVLLISVITVIIAQPKGEVVYFLLLFLPCALAFGAGYYIVIRRNQQVDEDISKVCTYFNFRFQEQGFSIQYKTMYTGLCKPRGTSPVRVIVFIPIPDYGEAKDSPSVTMETILDDGGQVVVGEGRGGEDSASIERMAINDGLDLEAWGID
jgi:hypothetical protein